MRKRWNQAGSILLSVLAVWLAAFAYMVLTGGMVTSITGLVVEFIGFGAFCLVLYLAAVKWIERRRADELSIANAGRELGAGVLAGLALFSLVMAICGPSVLIKCKVGADRMR